MVKVSHWPRGNQTGQGHRSAMKILHCMATLEGGGAERQLCYLAKGLVDAGHDVVVACMRLGVNGARLRLSGATIDVSGHPLSSPRNLWHLIRMLRQVRPDIVQTWLLPMDVWGGMAAIWTRTPWILSERTSTAHYNHLTFPLQVRRRVAQRVSMIVANSRDGQNYWRKELEGKGLAPRLIRNALPLAELGVVVPARPASIGGAERIILYAGRLDPGKNLRTLLLALPIVLKSEPFQVLICGIGPDSAQLQQLALDLSVAKQVRFLGYVDNLSALMKAADVFVSVSRYEGQPNAVMEAMACGCPLVVSDIPEHREFLNEQAAFFAQPESAADIAEQILRALQSPSLAFEKAQKARAIAQNWGIGEATQQYLEAYRSLMPAGANRSEAPSSHSR